MGVPWFKSISHSAKEQAVCTEWGGAAHPVAPLTQIWFSPQKIIQHSQSWLPSKKLLPSSSHVTVLG